MRQSHAVVFHRSGVKTLKKIRIFEQSCVRVQKDSLDEIEAFERSLRAVLSPKKHGIGRIHSIQLASLTTKSYVK